MKTLPYPIRRLRLKLTSWHTGLADNGLESTSTQFGLVWDGYGHRRIGKSLLHHHVAAMLAHLQETVAKKNGADLFPR